MTFGTFPLLLALFKLPLVGIGFVAIAAINKRKRLFEITIEVARDTGNLGVFPNERIFGFGMIEIEAGQESFPTAGSVAGFADLLKRTFVGIGVARGAGVELHVLITSSTARCVGLVTFLARNFYVKSSERVFCFGVIEILGGLPTFHVVALGAFASELAFMRIGVAGRAIRGLAEEGLREVLHFDQLAICRKHVRGRVAFFTDQRSVFAVELVTGEFVIELLQRGFPVD